MTISQFPEKHGQMPMEELLETDLQVDGQSVNARVRTKTPSNLLLLLIQKDCVSTQPLQSFQRAPWLATRYKDELEQSGRNGRKHSAASTGGVG